MGGERESRSKKDRERARAVSEICFDTRPMLSRSAPVDDGDEANWRVGHALLRISGDEWQPLELRFVVEWRGFGDRQPPSNGGRRRVVEVGGACIGGKM